MPTLKDEIKIADSLNEVWHWVTHFERMNEWFLGVKRVVVLSPELKAGAQRQLTLVTGASFHERMDDWEAPTFFSYRVLNPPGFIRAWKALIRLEPSEKGVRLTWEISFAMKESLAFILLGKILIIPGIKMLLHYSLRRLKVLVERS